MVIESKDRAAGPDPLTPIFTQRKIEGVARIPNGKTMMIASIAQDRESDGRAGLPLVGLIPILGRLFTTPKKDNTQSDIVITMTPRVLRAPEITPQDLEPKDTGTMQTPQSPSLEALIRDADREDALAAAIIRGRALPTNVTAQLPTPATSVVPAEEVTFVPAPKALAQTDMSTSTAANNPGTQAVNVGLGAAATPAPAVVKPAAETAAPATTNATAPPAVSAPPAPVAESTAELLLMTDRQELKVGERGRVMVFLKTDAPLGLATATLRFDPKALAVRSVTQGGLAGAGSGAPSITQSIDPSGVLVVSVAPAAGAPALTGEGLLLVIEIEGLAPGETGLQFDADKVHLVATDGRTVRPRTTPGRLKGTQ
jgi:general secretion pathway protein D